MAKPPIFIAANARLIETLGRCSASAYIDLDGDGTNLLRMYQSDKMDNLRGQPSQNLSKAIKDGLAVGYKLTNQRSTVVQPDNSNCTSRVRVGFGGNSFDWGHNNAVESVLPDSVSVRYRGRAVPVAWRVIEHKVAAYRLRSTNIYCDGCRGCWTQARVRFMADRGFADTKLMHYLEHDLGAPLFESRRMTCGFCDRVKLLALLKQFHLNLGDAILLQEWR